MEILTKIWTALSTENELLTKIIGLPFILLEMYVYMCLFTTILDIKSTKKQKIIYIVLSSLVGILCSLVIPKPYSNIITIIYTPLAIMFIFKVSFLKGIFSEFLILICVTVSELIITRLFFMVTGISYDIFANIPIYRLLATLSIYLLIYLISRIAMKWNLIINIWDNISKHNKKVILTNLIFALSVMFMQMYLIGYYNDKLPLFTILVNVLSLLAYFGISIFSLIKTMKLEKTMVDLEEEKMYNKTLQILHDNIRAFKHDFANILASIGGYVETNDMAGLKKYYKQLLLDCGQVNNLSTLNPDTINNPAVYAVLANKYYEADELGIKITLESFIDFNNLHMEIYEFARILGILMDNAIEAASECDEKLINVIIRNDIRQNRQLLIIENTYNNKDVDIDKIYEKGYSKKENHTGLGLWEVNKIISKHKNITRFTYKTDKFFKQQIEIYNE